MSVPMTNEEYAEALRNKWCMCGSKLPKHPEFDARGIFLCYCCDKYRKHQLSRYRADVLTDPNYWHDEPIEDKTDGREQKSNHTVT